MIHDWKHDEKLKKMLKGEVSQTREQGVGLGDSKAVVLQGKRSPASVLLPL